MSIPVLTAVADPALEADLVARLGTDETAARVVRRCVDIADLLAAAAAGLGRVAVVSADLRRLDQDAVLRLAGDGVSVIGVVRPGDDAAERRLFQLGVAEVLTADVDPPGLDDALQRAVVGRATELADPPPQADAPASQPAGDVVAVWGPTGAPGRSTVATALATELAALGVETLLVDADVYGGVVAQLLGLLDESPGVAAACRAANNGTLDVAGLARVAVEALPRLRVLTGITRADRWPELRPGALEVVLQLARQLASVTVVDCAFSLEADEELSFDTAAPRRNGATLAALDAADVVLAVASADPVGLQRYVRGLAELADAMPDVTPVPVVNRVRSSAVGGGDARREISNALERFAGVHCRWFVPYDLKAFDAAVAAGRTLAEAAPKSSARVALKELALSLVDAPAPLKKRSRRH